MMERIAESVVVVSDKWCKRLSSDSKSVVGGIDVLRARVRVSVEGLGQFDGDGADGG